MSTKLYNLPLILQQCKRHGEQYTAFAVLLAFLYVFVKLAYILLNLVKCDNERLYFAGFGLSCRPPPLRTSSDVFCSL